ncbi:MAG: hypothetical protein WA865_20680 [Spirulinaceae cyanobacterium]
MSKSNVNSSFNSYDTYPCPICHRGKVSSMPLMEAFACNFCSHIFTVDFEKQLMKIADRQLPLSWHWNGKSWNSLQQQKTEAAWIYVIAGFIFLILPTTIIGLGAYLFPPLPGSTLGWFPVFWTGLTFVAHLSFILWITVEYYQFPIFLYLRATGRNLLHLR